MSITRNEIMRSKLLLRKLLTHLPFCRVSICHLFLTQRNSWMTLPCSGKSNPSSGVANLLLGEE